MGATLSTPLVSSSTISASCEDREGAIHILWGHGWGQDRVQLRHLAQQFPRPAIHHLLEFPGFGSSPVPPQAWSSVNYAEDVFNWIQDQNLLGEPLIWIGHSFGGRVGVCLASQYPDLFKAMVLIASAGLRLSKPMRTRVRIAVYKLAKHILPTTLIDKVRTQFGSVDYQRTSSSLRGTFLKVVNEDLSMQASQVSCPTLLLYGAQDRDTPIKLAEKFHQKIRESHLKVLPIFDHHSILSQGQHQLLYQIRNFLHEYLEV